MPIIEPYVEPEEYMPNRYRFYLGKKVRFTENAIKERVHADYMSEKAAIGLCFYVTDVNNYPQGDGHSGQWVKVRGVNAPSIVAIDDWIDSYWFEEYNDLEINNPYLGQQ